MVNAFKQTFTNLTKLPATQVQQWIKSFETIICDADGVLWHFDKAIPGAAETFNQLQSSGRRCFVVTNNSGVTSDDLVKKANGFGIKLPEENMLTSARAIASYLSSNKFQKKVYFIGEEGIGKELDKVGIKSFAVRGEMGGQAMHDFAKELQLDPEVGAIVVGKDDCFTVPAIIRASSYLQDPKVLFLGTCLDAAYPIGNKRVMVGAAAMIAAVKAISGRRPLILGKPNPWMVKEQRTSGLIKPEKTLMIGDTVYTDMLFAHNNGFQSLFVGTGVSSVKDVEQLRHSGNKKHLTMVPDTYLPTLGHLKEFLA
ncbi:CG11291 [Drosophila busckii]|uniref:CG11291 n=2 Tax=Drosophila busckii TaxID=30019 RepID=A0A0M4EY33_DROBS|nr:CG11291 [Drosophila busckii]